MDEPTNGLDPVVRRQFLSLIVQETAGTGMSVLFATHRLEELETMADDVSILYQLASFCIVSFIGLLMGNAVLAWEWDV